MVVSLQSGCSLIQRGNQDRSNIVSNENGRAKTSESIKNHREATKDNSSPEEKQNTKDKNKEEKAVEPKEDSSDNKSNKLEQTNKENENAIHVISQPEAIAVLVNKQNKLPDHYAPEDLVIPNVRFINRGNFDKNKMRKEAARALEKMFAGAEKDGILLAGASGYRSQATQEILYNSYVKRDGKAAAERYSANPGHSEHQTGLAMDVSGINGKCAAMDCFGGSPEANWLTEHAHEYGYIVRYLKGKEHITGYQYEPWHMRYVGIDIAKETFEKNITLEEYFDSAIPVSGNK
ncbi:M15 family metallopeptidase [Bacillus sp. FJAT-49732]|uniref:M15 family metallopeptidase n=2 Tax=Lederbergia citrisecunda TaxID=2833583 RepID=A0A942TR52_9BACI|nr:M15 family metallopeptidase [Lederbergia citrisecunda]MBS4201818.1 M15 family metallopeptidase [Lederbergia citrisecunda]